VVDSSSGQVSERKRHSFFVDFFIRLLKEKPLGTVGAVITLLLLLTGIFADFLAPYGYNEMTGEFLAGPTSGFWLGTDNLSRDLLSRVIYGARVSVIVGLAAPAMSTLIGIVIGVTSGYAGGKFDLVVQRFVDAVMCLPWLVLLMVLMSLLGTSKWTLVLCMGGVWGITGSRFSRSVVISIKENVYVAAAKAIGCPTSRILTRHILPNIMAPIVIGFTASVPGVILAEASLSFLGFGIPPPEPSWGGMLSGSGRRFMFLNPWMVIWPGLALSTVVYGINMFGDAVRDLLDPRLRGGAGRYGARAKKEAAVKSEPSSSEGLTKR